MSFDLKRGLDYSPEHETAARRRVEDVPHKTFTPDQLDAATKSTIEKDTLLEPVYSPPPGGVVSSQKYVRFAKNARYHHAQLASKSDRLYKEILRSSEQHLSLLDDVQKAVGALDAFITEDEMRFVDGYTQVHFNAFLRTLDFGLDFDELRWSRDWKTNLPIRPGGMCTVVPEAGVTLPLLHNSFLPFINVELVGEAADIGDTKRVLADSDPRNVMLENKAYRHVIARREFDGTSRKYPRGEITVTLQGEFPSLQLVNSVTIKPGSYSTFFLKKLSYVNDNGETVDLDVVQTEADRNISLFFEPVYARYLIFTFVQYAPVERTQVSSGDAYTEAVNDVLYSIGWEQHLEDTAEVWDSAVYDFSIQGIECHLRTYDSIGMYASQPIQVEELVGVSTDDSFESLNISNDQRTYGSRYFLDDGDVLLERYVGLYLKGANDQIVVDALVPLRDEYPFQREILPIFGKESRLKLFPDLVTESLLTEATAVYTFSAWAVNLSSPIDGLVVDPTTWVTDGNLLLAGPPGHALNVVADEYLVISDTELLVKVTSSGFTTDITANTAGKLRVGLLSDLEDTPSFTLKADDTALGLGTDYYVSLDDGATWVTTWSALLSQYVAMESFVAGHCRVKFLNPDYAKYHWVTYRVEAEQYVSENKLVRLIGGRLVVDRGVSNVSGEVSMVYIFRGHHDNRYLTPVLSNYSLRVRERNVG